MGEALMRHRVRRRLPKFTYTGSYTVIDDGHGDWRIRFLSSGTLTFLTNVPKGIDVFVVGAGGGGAVHVYGAHTVSAYGGAGRSSTQQASVTKGTGYVITIGAGGKSNAGHGGGDAGRATWTYGANGGSSSAFGHSASGGTGGTGATQDNTVYGGDIIETVTNGTGGSAVYEFGGSSGTRYALSGSSAYYSNNSGNGGRNDSFNGSSGIVVIRNHRE